MKKFLSSLAVAVASLAAASTASATSVTWNLSGVDFTTGNPVVDTATATGSFTIDSATLQVISFDVLVSGGTVSLANGGLADANHEYKSTAGDELFLSSSQAFFCTSNCFGSSVNLTLAFGSSPVNLTSGNIFLTSSTLDCPRCGTLSDVGTAKITTDSVNGQVAAVPEPATLALLGTGLFGLAARARRKLRR